MLYNFEFQYFHLKKSLANFYLSGCAEPVGCKPAEWRGSRGRVSNSPRGYPGPAAGDPAAALH